MLPIQLSPKGKAKYQILCLGSHSDDIEIGCGGTILRFAHEYPSCEFVWVVFSSGPQRKQEALKSAQLFLKKMPNRIFIENYKTSFFPQEGEKIKEYFEGLKAECSPDLIFTHYRNDLHQDHRIISDLTWNTFRNHLILEYEIPKYDGDLGQPNLFVALNRRICDRKIDHILRCFVSQRDKHWFTEDTFRALLRLRGVEAGPTTPYAEAFFVRKIVL